MAIRVECPSNCTPSNFVTRAYVKTEVLVNSAGVVQEVLDPIETPTLSAYGQTFSCVHCGKEADVWIVTGRNETKLDKKEE